MKAGEEGAGDVESVEAHEAMGEDDGIFGGCCVSVNLISLLNQNERPHDSGPQRASGASPHHPTPFKTEKIAYHNSP